MRKAAKNHVCTICPVVYICGFDESRETRCERPERELGIHVSNRLSGGAISSEGGDVGERMLSKET